VILDVSGNNGTFFLDRPPHGRMSIASWQASRQKKMDRCHLDECVMVVVQGRAPGAHDGGPVILDEYCSHLTASKARGPRLGHHHHSVPRRWGGGLHSRAARALQYRVTGWRDDGLLDSRRPLCPPSTGRTTTGLWQPVCTRTIFCECVRPPRRMAWKPTWASRRR
jgi:hypothetical protein